jgi:hypothetical protein
LEATTRRLVILGRVVWWELSLGASVVLALLRLRLGQVEKLLSDRLSSKACSQNSGSHALQSIGWVVHSVLREVNLDALASIHHIVIGVVPHIDVLGP